MFRKVLGIRMSILTILWGIGSFGLYSPKFYSNDVAITSVIFCILTGVSCYLLFVGNEKRQFRKGKNILQ